MHGVFTTDGNETWTVEDGGRVRHRSAAGNWAFEATPSAVQDTLRRAFVHDGETSSHVFAVGQDGRLLSKLILPGSPWVVRWRQFEDAPGLDPAAPADLWDVHVVRTQTEGDLVYILGLHGIWRGIGSLRSANHWSSATFWDSTDPHTAQSMAKEQLELYSFDFHPDGLALACGQPGVIFKQSPTDLDRWEKVFDIRELCVPLGGLQGCVRDAVCVGGVEFEMWDLAISRHPTQPLALAVGGVGTGCGLILASTDGGQTWTQEPHECQCLFGGCTSCNGHLDYTNNGGPDETWRLRKFFELYGVAIFDEDNSAVACGYSGQIVVRDPNPSGAPVWRDRSSYSGKQLEAPSAITTPMIGAATNGGNGATGIGVVTGMGGYVRRSTNGGQDWENDQPGEGWRIQDVHFANVLDGWMVGQYHRIARTTNSGVDWTQQNSGASKQKGNLHSIAVDPNGLLGVAVGVGNAHEWPAILVNDDALVSSQWINASTNVIAAEPSLVVSGKLNEVAWVAGDVFWAVGDQGLILRSLPTVTMSTWAQFVPSGETYSSFSNFTINGVAFAGAAHGVLVGARLITGVQYGKAYHYRDSNPTELFEIAIPNELDHIELTSVAFDGTTAYATGTYVLGAIHKGVILKATLSGGVFSPFVVAAPSFDACTVGESIEAAAILAKVETAPGGAIWVGGQCGRLWRSTDGANWSSVRSMTDSHVRGMSFVAADTGYVAGHRPSRTGSSIVAILP